MNDPTTSRTGATGDHTVRGVPRCATSLTPYIAVPDVALAVDHYRFAAIRDPHGVRWSIMSRVEDLSEAESAERIAAWVAAGQDDA